MSERAAMKRRVRGLLHRKWVPPLGALALAWLPTLGAFALALALIIPSRSAAPSIFAQISNLFEQAQDPGLAIITLVYGFELDFAQLISMLPGLAVFAGIYLFVGMPVSVSASGYFLGFLRGKAVKAWEVFLCFSGRYPRYLGGMLYMLLWVVLWALAAFAMPIALYSAGVYLTAHVFGELLGAYQLWVFGGLIAFCVLWFVIFTLLFAGRLLAYSLTPVCISAQPRLPAYRAVRLSRKLMRGCKWRLIGQYASFVGYYVPTIIAGVLLLVMRYAGPRLALTEILRQSLRLLLWIIIGINQLVIVYVAPYMAACFRAFYIERKREALMDEEVTPDDFAPKQRADYRLEKPRQKKNRRKDSRAADAEGKMKDAER
ncbi:MAG: DUF975 family protein [Firmicutes bacterium]|nr:DUF975 family protein [Bacillota bacterium]